MQTEYVRSLNCNYERILLEKKPEEKRYQYCILSRGGIKGLLPCSLRYINGQAYLYYDISSRQNIFQLYGNRYITRDWMRDFAWSLKRIRQELGRFLLDTCNILWYPEQIFQDLESNVFSFLYIPYYEGESSFIKLVEFWVEHIDYEDETLVNCVYRIYEQIEKNGETYLQSRIFEDMECLEDAEENNTGEKLNGSDAEIINEVDAIVKEQDNITSNYGMRKKAVRKEGAQKEAARKETVRNEAGRKEAVQKEAVQNETVQEGVLQTESLRKERTQKERTQKETGIQHSRKRQKNIFSIFEGKKERSKKLRDDYRKDMQRAMAGYVAEETPYEEEEYGRTVYIEDTDSKERVHKLYTLEGKIILTIEKSIITIGKKKGEADVVLEDASVSRLHARIILEKEDAYLEDLNSTNGTFKNGLRLQPYEKRKLEEEDEIKCGKAVLVFR